MFFLTFSGKLKFQKTHKYIKCHRKFGVQLFIAKFIWKFFTFRKKKFGFPFPSQKEKIRIAAFRYCSGLFFIVGIVFPFFGRLPFFRLTESRTCGLLRSNFTSLD
jgi:hypothetical protein